MPKITIEIKSCKDCPNFIIKDQYSSDGWDRMEDWFCNLANKKIQGAVEWHEEKHIKIPEWCPAAIKESNN